MVAVAIRAFRRADTLRNVLESVATNAADIECLYIGIDCPTEGSRDQNLVSKVLTTAVEFSMSVPFRVRIRQPRMPLGLGTNVLATASWMFYRHDEGIFLEDDCVPGDGFFGFVEQALPLLRGDDQAWMICGSQYLPASDQQFVIRSPLPLIWGWASISMKWQALLTGLRNALIEAHRNPWLRGVPWSPERSFWESGLRHVAFGEFDTWDLPVVAAMRQSDACAYLPSRNLVSNIGDGPYSVHIQAGNRWVRRPAEAWSLDEPLVTRNLGLDEMKWLQSNVHGVRDSSPVRARASALRRRLAGRHVNRSRLMRNWEVISGGPSSDEHFVDVTSI